LNCTDLAAEDFMKEFIRGNEVMDVLQGSRLATCPVQYNPGLSGGN